jgi:hypothetical protein
MVMLGLSDAQATRVLGGGPKQSDCYASFEVTGATAQGKRIAQCADGDAACDSDGQVNNACQFSVSVCVFQTDVIGCEPKTVTKIPKAGFPVPTFPASATACGEAKSVRVRVKKRKAIRLVAHVDGKPKVDRDSIVLKCVPGVASPAGAFLDAE